MRYDIFVSPHLLICEFQMYVYILINMTSYVCVRINVIFYVSINIIFYVGVGINVTF